MFFQLLWQSRIDFGSYSGAPEILEYFRRIAQDYDLYRVIRLNHRVIGAKWHGAKGMWNVTVENTVTEEVLEDWAHFMITGSGILKSVPDQFNYCAFD